MKNQSTFLIQLTRGQQAIVDVDDYTFLLQWTWYAAKAGRFGFYAARSSLRNASSRKTFLMHRVILQRQLGRTLFRSEEADHINGNKLDNRRGNLRLVSSRQNKCAFKHKSLGTSSKFRGVCWSKKDGKWQAQIKLNGKNNYLGQFASESEAMSARAIKERELFGEFAQV